MDRLECLTATIHAIDRKAMLVSIHGNSKPSLLQRALRDMPAFRSWLAGGSSGLCLSSFVTWGAVQGDRRALPGPEAGFEGTLLLLLLARQAGLELVVPPFGQGCACILWEAWPRQELYSRKDLPS